MVYYPNRFRFDCDSSYSRQVGDFMWDHIVQLMQGVISILQIPINFGSFSVDIFSIIIGLCVISLVAFVINRIFD